MTLKRKIQKDPAFQEMMEAAFEFYRSFGDYSELKARGLGELLPNEAFRTLFYLVEWLTVTTAKYEDGMTEDDNIAAITTTGQLIHRLKAFTVDHEMWDMKLREELVFTLGGLWVNRLEHMIVKFEAADKIMLKENSPARRKEEKKKIEDIVEEIINDSEDKA